jgi:hypothetical protein
MPTTARLVAGLLMAALAYFVAELIKPYMPPEQPVGLLSPVSAGFGFLIGWAYTGRHLQRGVGTPFGIGLAGVMLVVFWVVVVFSVQEMVQRSMRLFYHGPVEAMQGMIDIALGYLKTAAQIDVIIAAVIGGFVVGLITKGVAERYR